MGYGVLEDRQDNVTYKDIAGISIIREFHTDTNHTWMKRINDDSTIDLICVQCNGVLYDIDMDLNGITYQGQNVNIYKDCIHHGGTTSNMLLVATDGERNFFKCQNCRHIETVEISEEFSLSNYSSTINKIITLNSNETKYYKINSNYNKYYEFIIKGISTFTIKLFDDNFNEIPITNLNDSNLADYIINQLQGGTYYLELKNISSISNSISLKIVSRTTAYIGVGDNDVLLNTHNYNEGIYQNNYYYYINNRGVGFYRFTLTGIKTDGTEITYPVGTIVIKDHKNEDVIDKYSFIGYFNQAITDYNENTFIAYLNAIGYFYVYIDIETEGLKSLTLNIEPVESEIIDLFTKSSTINSHLNIFNYETLKGDYIKELNLKQSGKFTISYNYNGSQINDMLFVLSKLNYNEQTNKYSLEIIISQLMDVENNAYTNTLNLTDGIYYIGYFNKKDTGTFNISFNRLVTEYNPNTLVTDPEKNTDCGSQINVYESDIDIYERSYRSTEIVKGFTRIIYFDVNLVNQYSRGDYYWYSSNNSVATVSQHGTVFGETCGNVKIMAVNKDNSSIVFVKEFTIIPDTKTYTTSKIIKINDTYKTSNNTDYKLGLTIQNSPYPMVQYYTWQIYYRDDTITSVQLDEYGNVVIKGTGEVIFWGKNYIYNNNYEIRIHVKVTE